jgi:hypothetical protein
VETRVFAFLRIERVPQARYESSEGSVEGLIELCAQGASLRMMLFAKRVASPKNQGVHHAILLNGIDT